VVAPQVVITRGPARPAAASAVPAADAADERHRLVARSRRLNIATLAYNTLEGIIAISAGLAAGSVALVGFGIDSGIELGASGAALWRLHADADVTRRAVVERRSHRVIGALFIILAIYVAVDASTALWNREAPGESPIGIALAAASVLVMPLLARAKRRVGLALGSRALTAEASQTALCTYLSAILLVGLGLNAWLGWWWADPVAALAMLPIIVREGVEGLRGAPPCCDDCG
jgi:divalent metal cation (Fe/Co/Zn/Cd) transporter